jgi:hypothetical protein
MHDNVTLKNIWDQSVNCTKKLRKLLVIFRLLDWKIIAYTVLPIYWAIIILGTFSSRGPWSGYQETYLHVQWITDHGA